MSTSLVPVTTTPTLNDKIEQAAAEAGQIASIFSPAVGAAIESGVAVEPLIYGLISMFVGLFKHHTTGSVAPAPVAQAIAAADAESKDVNATSFSPEKDRRIAELEAPLADKDEKPVEILPDGSIREVPVPFYGCADIHTPHFGVTHTPLSGDEDA